MKPFLVAIAFVSCVAFAGQDDFEFSTGALSPSSTYTETKADPKSGCIEQIDVSVTGTSAVRVVVSTVSTNGTKVGKTLLSLTSITSSGSYPVRQFPVNSSGTSLTNGSPVEFYLSEDRVQLVVSNINVSVTNSVKVTVISEEE